MIAVRLSCLASNGTETRKAWASCVADPEMLDADPEYAKALVLQPLLDHCSQHGLKPDTSKVTVSAAPTNRYGVSVSQPFSVSFDCDCDSITAEDFCRQLKETSCQGR